MSALTNKILKAFCARLLPRSAFTKIRPVISRAKTAIYNSTPASILAMIVAACGGGGGSSTPAKPAPPELHITNNGRDIASDGVGLLREEIDGSSSPVPLGTIGDSKNTNGEAYYKLAEDDEATGTDNAAFEIIGDTGAQILRFKGTDSGDLEGNGQLTLKIIRYNNKADADAERSPQILDYIVNLINFDEALTITNADGKVILSDGEGLIPENYNGDESAGGTPFRLGEVGDNGEISLGVTYRLADTPANADYELKREEDGGIYTYTLYYTGKDSGDFEAKDFLIVDVIRTIDGTDQSLKYLVNLNNVNDNPPVITGYEGESETAIDNIAAGKVGSDLYEMVLKLAANGDQITIDFERGGSTLLLIEPEYAVSGDTTSKVTKFVITTGIVSYAGIATALNGDTVLRDANADFTVWDEYVSSVTYIGSASGGPPRNNPLFSSDVTLTAKATIEVNQGTTGTIADFGSSTDPDGDLNDIRYSVSDTANFDITADGKLSFKAAPSYDTSTPANNTREVTITVSDGTFSKTYPLQIVVLQTSSSQGTGTSAAEAVPNTDEDPATPEATKPSIGRRILDYLFGSQEEHRQMQNQQIENMFSGDSDLDPLNPQDPDIL